MNKIKKEDMVEVITGAYKGQSGRVIKILTTVSYTHLTLPTTPYV